MTCFLAVINLGLIFAVGIFSSAIFIDTSIEILLLYAFIGMLLAGAAALSLLITKKILEISHHLKS